jgi:outer membrane lipoprotein-sorting protein
MASLLVGLSALAAGPRAAGSAPSAELAPDIIGKMEAAYARVEQYRTETEVRDYRAGQVVETARFVYTFRKPDHIRIDFLSPHRGMTLVYPDEQGRAVVKPGGWLGFLKLRLAPDSARLRSPSGQRIDQTDLGLLIQNIARSLTDRRRGEMKVADQDGRTQIEVLAEDHFLPGVLTLYRFTVDDATWLPVEVQELTPEGVPKRQVSFANLRTSVNAPESYFRIGDRNPGHGRSRG